MPDTEEPHAIPQTPIQLAISLGHIETVQAILENISHALYRQLLKNAIRNNEFKTVDVLMKKFDPLQNILPDTEEPHAIPQTPIQLAVSLGHIETAQAILENTSHALDRNNGNLLYIAVRKNDHAMITLLLGYFGLSRERRKGEEKTPLQLAYDEKHIDCVKAFISQHADAEEYKSIDPQAQAEYKLILIQAVQDSQYNLVELLLDVHTPQQCPDPQKGTCLHIAVKNNDPQMIELLLDYQGYHYDKHEYKTDKETLLLSPIELAAHLEHWECVKPFAIRHKATSKDDVTAYAKTLESVVSNSKGPNNLIEPLVEAGGSLKNGDFYKKFNILDAAIKSKNTTKIALLLLSGFDPLKSEFSYSYSTIYNLNHFTSNSKPQVQEFRQAFEEGWLKYNDMMLLKLILPFLFRFRPLNQPGSAFGKRNQHIDHLFPVIISFLWLPGIPFPDADAFNALSNKKMINDAVERHRLTKQPTSQKVFSAIENFFENAPITTSELKLLNLTMAIKNNCSELTVQLIRTIPSKGAIWDRFKLAIELGHSETVKAMVNAIGNLDEDMEQSNTALIIAVQKRHFNLAKLLVDAGVKANTSSLVAAIKTGNIDLSRLCLENFSKQYPGDDFPPYWSFKLAIQNNDPPMIILLLHFSTKIPRDPAIEEIELYPIAYAAHLEYWDCVKALTTKKTGKNDFAGYSLAIDCAAGARRYDIVRLLAEDGGKTFQTNNDPIYLAIKNNDAKMIALLLSLGFKLLSFRNRQEEFAFEKQKNIFQAGKSMHHDAKRFMVVSPFLFRALNQPESFFGKTYKITITCKVGETYKKREFEIKLTEELLERIASFLCPPGAQPPTVLSNNNMIAKASAKSVLAGSQGLFHKHSEASQKFLNELGETVKNSFQADNDVKASVSRFRKKNTDPQSRTMLLLSKFKTICPPVPKEAGKKTPEQKNPSKALSNT